MMNKIRKARPVFRAAVSLLALLLITGCTTTVTSSSMATDPFFDEWQEARTDADMPRTESGAPMGEPAVAVVSEEIPPSGAHAAEPVAVVTTRELPKDVIRDFKMPDKTDVGTVLRALARAAELNILISENADATVNFNFTEVPWDQAFQSVLTASGLTYTWEGDIIRVMTLDDMKRELELEKLQQERETVKAELRKVEPLQIQIVKVRFMSAESMGKTLKALLVGNLVETEGATARGSVTVDDENNAVILHAIKEDIEKMKAMIAQLDVPRPQVLIEAQIVEANRDTARQLGIQWGGVSTTLEGNRVNTLGAASLGANIADTLEEDVGLTLGFLTERFGGGDLLSMQLTALQEDGRIKILSNPSITTLDNETASIESGEERAYRETSGTGNDLDVSIEWKKAVLRLEVTPHVIDEKRLKLEVTASKDSFDDTKQESNGEFPVNTKNAVTSIMLFDGETTVIGGLSQESEGSVDKGVPFLKDIPLVGYLFKGKTTSKTLDETLIFITPHIL